VVTLLLLLAKNDGDNATNKDVCHITISPQQCTTYVMADLQDFNGAERVLSSSNTVVTLMSSCGITHIWGDAGVHELKHHQTHRSMACTIM
jgi:hypothetical protein